MDCDCRVEIERFFLLSMVIIENTWIEIVRLKLKITFLLSTVIIESTWIETEIFFQFMFSLINTSSI